MFKINKLALILASTLALGSTATFADDLIDYDGKPEQKVIYPVNGKSGFVFNKLSQVFKTSSQGYNTIIVDSSNSLSSYQVSQIKNYLEQGVTIIIDAKAGMGTAQAVAQKIAGFSVNSEAIMIKKSSGSAGGYDVTPVSSSVYSDSKASMSDGSAHVSNTVDDVFGL
ncbi:hypothetical protein P256_00440 [Acinetobacter nectaris CIP 110549]|uniref:Tail specific protease domain-containing protein n=1 Tax=Acinetobacter nectaris CIP 110549 TaxID=1392540 RepID=V2TPQ0_9GAMM|nr:hypothetical protein [Acinetobacter nectaris]ESK40001.1 hypothetical protein P256_00440 [Acinetobacter nectaris CIP 110549]